MAETGHLQMIDRELTAMIEEGKDTKIIVKWVKERVLESYRNGLGAGSKVSKEDVDKANRAVRSYQK